MSQACEILRNFRNYAKFMKIFNRLANIMIYGAFILFIPSMIIKVTAIAIDENIASSIDSKMLNQTTPNQKQFTRKINDNLSALNHKIDEDLRHNMRANHTLHRHDGGEDPQHLRPLHGMSSVNSANENDYLLERNGSHERPVVSFDKTMLRLTKAKPSEPSEPPLPKLLQSIPSIQQEPWQQSGPGQHTMKLNLNSKGLENNNKDESFLKQPNEGGRDWLNNTMQNERFTLKPNGGELHDQIPRPPALATNLLRRQSNDEDPKSSQSLTENQPPDELPRKNDEDINNMEHLLHNLYLNEMVSPPLPSVPPYPASIVPPTGGLFIPALYHKNLKSSNLLNFLRHKRYKSSIPAMWQYQQLYGPQAIPVPPPHMLNVYPTPITFDLVNPHPHPHPYPYPYPHFHSHQYHQSPYQPLTMNNFYPIKSKSLNDLSLLQQQQYQIALKYKPKKLNKKKNKSELQSKNIWPASPYGPSASIYPQFVPLNASQLPISLMPQPKRLPYKTNLDPYSMMASTKISYRMPRPIKDVAPIHPAQMRYPFTEYFTIPPPPPAPGPPPAPAPGAASVTATANNQQSVRFPESLPSEPIAQSSMNYTPSLLEIPKHLQYSQQRQHSPIPIPSNNCEQQQQENNDSGNIETTNSKGSSILLHLNLIPSQRQTTDAAGEIHPMYANLIEIQRTHDHDHENDSSSKQNADDHSKLPFNRRMNSIINESNRSRIMKLSHSDLTLEGHLPSMQMTLTPLMASINRNDSRVSRIPTGQGQSHDLNRGAESDMQSPNKSQFRYPVEDLITFQYQDAMEKNVDPQSLYLKS